MDENRIVPAEYAEERDCPAWFNGKSVDEAAFSEAFLAEHPMKCLRGRLFSRGGLIENEDLICREIAKQISGYVRSGVSGKAASILACMKLMCTVPGLPVQQDRIHFRNGTLVLGKGFAEEADFCLNRLPVNWNPSAPKPERWLRFLNDLLYPEDILTLQQYLGYCLIPTTKAQKMLLIVGKGGEGKSRIGRVLSGIFGSSMNTTSIQKIETNRFARADLEHKLLMVDDDMDLGALPKTNYIKSIVTAETPMDLERKGVQSHQALLYTRFLCFGNGALETLYDKSEGFYRRQIILTTKDRPKDRKDDPFLAEAMLAEREGIVNWMLDGLYDLLAREFRFSVSSRAQGNLEVVKRSSNNIIDFLRSDGYIRFRADGEITSRALYACYQRWCDDNSVKALSAQRLSSELMQNGERYNVEYTSSIRLGTHRVRGFRGVEEARGGDPCDAF